MPPKRTGAVKWAGDHWTARIRLNDGRRIPIHFPLGTSEADAERQAAEWSEMARRGELVFEGKGKVGAPGETFAQYASRWLEHRAGRGLASVRVDRSALDTHVTPLLGPKRMRDMAPDDVRAVVERLDDKVAAGEMSAKWASNVWCTLHKLLTDARRSKVRALRVLSADPLHDVEPPDHGAERLTCFLFPAEMLQLLACNDVDQGVLEWCAMQTWLTLRPAELFGLDGESVDLAHWFAHVHQSRDLETLETKATKTGRDRRVPIEPSIRPLVVSLVDRAGRGPLFPTLPFRANAASDELRAWLKVARVDRAALHTSDRTRRALRLYDLRSTGATWCAARGDSGPSIQERLGHADYRQTQAYVRAVNVIRDAFGEPFPPLPAAFLARLGGAIGNGIGNGATPPETEGGETAMESLSGRDRDRTGRSDVDPWNSAAFRAHNPTEPDGQPRESSSRAQSETQTGNPRAALVAALTTAIRDTAAAGDLAAARIALEALNQLLGAAEGASAGVADLAARRGGGRR
jgi:integrase